MSQRPRNPIVFAPFAAPQRSYGAVQTSGAALQASPSALIERDVNTPQTLEFAFLFTSIRAPCPTRNAHSPDFSTFDTTFNTLDVSGDRQAARNRIR
jgi:hypothetical protein